MFERIMSLASHGVYRRDLESVAAVVGYLAGTACDLKVEGADKVLKGLPGGIDGVYQVTSCESGRPLYTRTGKKAGGAGLVVRLVPLAGRFCPSCA